MFISVLMLTHQHPAPAQDEDIDGQPLAEDVDGTPMEGDIDGKPLAPADDDDIDGVPLAAPPARLSKWEREDLPPAAPLRPVRAVEAGSERPEERRMMDDKRRAELRRIEVCCSPVAACMQTTPVAVIF